PPMTRTALRRAGHVEVFAWRGDHHVAAGSATRLRWLAGHSAGDNRLLLSGLPHLRDLLSLLDQLLLFVPDYLLLFGYCSGCDHLPVLRRPRAGLYEFLLSLRTSSVSVRVLLSGLDSDGRSLMHTSRCTTLRVTMSPPCARPAIGHNRSA